MDIHKSLSNYINVYNTISELGHWSSNTTATNARAVLKTISYFTVIAPLLAGLGYLATTPDLFGRMTHQFQSSTVNKVQQFVRSNQIYESFNFLFSSIEDFKASPKQRKAFFEQDKQKEHYSALIQECGGWDAFDQKLQDADNEALSMVFPKDRFCSDIQPDCIQALRYALLYQEEFQNLSLKDLANPLAYTSAQVLDFRLSKIPTKTMPAPENILEAKVTDLRSMSLSREQILSLVNHCGPCVLHLLSNNQLTAFIQTAKETPFTKEQALNVFYYSGLDKKYFHVLPLEQASDLTRTCPNEFKNHLSHAQEKNYFGNLQAEQVDQKLYDTLFGREEWNDVAKTQRFKLLSEATASGLMTKFHGEPKDLLTTEQEKHYFGNLKADQVDQKLYDTLFGLEEIYVDAKTQRFQHLSHETVAGLMTKFHGRPKNLLTKEQEKHYFGNLKAEQVDQELYGTLFGSREWSDSAKEQRFKLLSEATASGLMTKFHGRPKNLLTMKQEKHYFGNLKAEQVDQELYDTLLGGREWDEKAKTRRWTLLSNEQAGILLKKFLNL
ncbi:MAG: hypothetical protein FJZ58_03535 [Chlamydiae bacterium]|nr:hypothetical protein [Chlamydiota bacterium]